MNTFLAGMMLVAAPVAFLALFVRVEQVRRGQDEIRAELRKSNEDLAEVLDRHVWVTRTPEKRAHEPVDLVHRSTAAGGGSSPVAVRALTEIA